MIKCNVCNANNTDDGRFCRNCGSSLEPDYTCGECGHLNREESKFCTNCGAALETGAKVLTERNNIVEEDVGEVSAFPWKAILIGVAAAALIMAIALSVVLLRRPGEQVARGRVSPVGASVDAPTYQGAIKAILDEKCVVCHSDKGLVPQAKNGIPLTMERYRGAFLLKNMILDQVVSGKMPVNFNRENNTFEEAPPLSPDEIRTLVNWVRAGAPEN